MMDINVLDKLQAKRIGISIEEYKETEQKARTI